MNLIDFNREKTATIFPILIAADSLSNRKNCRESPRNHTDSQQNRRITCRESQHKSPQILALNRKTFKKLSKI